MLILYLVQLPLVCYLAIKVLLFQTTWLTHSPILLHTFLAGPLLKSHTPLWQVASEQGHSHWGTCQDRFGWDCQPVGLSTVDYPVVRPDTSLGKFQLTLRVRPVDPVGGHWRSDQPTLQEAGKWRGDSLTHHPILTGSGAYPTTSGLCLLHNGH